jgi:hypothetical protein
LAISILDLRRSVRKRSVKHSYFSSLRIVAL